MLTDHFLKIICDRLNCPRLRISQQNDRELQQYSWPGNVRELQNAIERAVITSRSGKLRFDLAEDPLTAEPAPAIDAYLEQGDPIEVITEAKMQEKRRANMMMALQACRGKIYGHDGAAAMLGLKPTTLASRMKRMNLNK